MELDSKTAKIRIENISGASQTDREKINKMKEDDIDLSDIPEITDKMFAEAVLRSGGKKVSKRKLRVNILLDADIVAYFNAASGGKGYQTLINETL